MLTTPFTSSNHQAGLTLVEVMMAVLVFTVGILAVAALQGMSRQSTATARKSMFNSVAAGEQIEQILSMAYDDERLVDTDNGYNPETPDHGPFAIAKTGGTVEWEVHDDYPSKQFKRITVTVRWPDRGGAMRSFSYGYVKSRDLS